ncbi:hypothetical protein SPRG_13608 [Saprolegnia parasitica CBS 223.65]|uniref:Uncharacterized protein n=1 Tax=Saprolegnia parasitica (strain CBS 223.65) TaxID=695850 RepID=A0A067C194_SAPPC|nr:hypothetical protein SPRG_13608 [Saprolegnia parasitica CBS 223.65]KDO20577.1 hypothetical protein SPRG_13608 [Saprolegnia parasitica CBS 223.65]|eukprot:XP_012208703.1 hypothetical protein SPRG_13608 [Saprolegnia parasitica CBS 223.65]
MWVQLVIGSILAASFAISGHAIYTLGGGSAVLEAFQYKTPSTYYVHVGFRFAMLALYAAVLIAEAEYLGIKMVSFYTVWNFILQGIYYLWAIKYQLATSGSREKPITVTREGAHLNSLFSICFANSLLVIVVYWGFLYNPNMRWYSYIQHGGNTLLFLIEFALNGFLVQGTDVIYVSLFPAIYAIFIWISNATWLNGWWPYRFLAMETPVAPLWYIGIFLGHFVMFGLALAISSAKAKYFPSLCPVVHANKLFMNSINYDTIA